MPPAPKPLILATPVFHKLRKVWNKYRYYVLQGSSRSSKTFSILQNIIDDYEHNPGKRCLIIRNKLTWIKTSLFPDFRKLMIEQFRSWTLGHMNRHEWTFTFPNGSEIIFIGLDSDDGFERAHGMGCDDMYVNECVEIDWNIIDQLRLRCSGRMIFDFNPNCAEDHWVFKIMKDPECFFMLSTFNDNPFCPPKSRQAILDYNPDDPANVEKHTADKTKWLIYGLGQRAQVEGLIFPDYEVVDEFPRDAKFTVLGLDWGYAHDKTAVLKVGIWGGKRYFKEILYKTGLAYLHNPTNPHRLSIEKCLRDRGITNQVAIYADSADPRGIDELKSAGFLIRKVDKPKGSIMAGIDEMKRYPICVVKGSDNFEYELQRYTWAKDRHGNWLNEPVDAFCDLCDAGRYACMMTSQGSEMAEHMPHVLKRVHGRQAADEFDFDNLGNYRRHMKATRSAPPPGRGKGASLGYRGEITFTEREER